MEEIVVKVDMEDVWGWVCSVAEQKLGQQILAYLHFEVSPRFVMSNKINLSKVNQI